jgi:aldose sugar dehydrogenase
VISSLSLFCIYILPIYADDQFVMDRNLRLELVTDGLNFPTGLAFLGQDDILVLEKEGKVQRIVNNRILQDPALDLTSFINSTRERGLLGIAIFDGNSNNHYDLSGKNNIYLYYTENIFKRQHVTSDCTLEKCSPNDLVVNSLYKYKFKDGKLVNPKLLLSVPLDKKLSLQHIGGVITIGPDNNIYISTGDGNLCRKPETCKTSIKDGLLNSQSVNMENGNTPLGSGGILYLKVDNSSNTYKPILGDEYPLGLYYAYGIRNSFGLDFDPITGYLWDTENGPFYGDEINLVEPGFNSGWPKKQGIWSITDYSQIAVDPPIGEKRGYHIPTESRLEGDYSKLFDFNGKGKYSDPEFTWNDPVGVTSIEFLNSDKLGKQYENDMFVATHNDGFVYHFDLDEKRKNLLLQEKLEDKVADNNKELKNNIFAKDLSAITDLETGPDGFLYILSSIEGKIWRIVPSGTTTTPHHDEK